MNLPGAVITTLYSEGTAIALVLGLIVHTVRLRKNGTGEHLFSIVTVHALCLAVSGMISHVLLIQDSEALVLCGKVVRNLYELMIPCILFYWLLFLDYMIYGSKDHLYRKYTMPFVPIVVCSVILVINAFTHIVFDFDENLTFEPKAFFWMLIVLEYAYIINSIVLLFRYYARIKGPKFIRIFPFLIPFVAGSFVTRMSPYEVRSLGIAVGLVLLHFSFMNERCFKDEETGFYNKAFLGYLANFSQEHGSEGGCAILFDGAEKGSDLAAVLRDEIPDNSAVVNMGHGRYLVISTAQSREAIKLFITAVEEAASEENIEISSDYVVVRSGESAEGKIKKLLEQ